MIGLPQKTAAIIVVAGAVVSAALLSPQVCLAFGERGHAGVFQAALRLLRATESCATPWTDYSDPSRAPTIWPDAAIKYNLEWIPSEYTALLGALNSGDHYFDPRSSQRGRIAGSWTFDDDDDPETPQTQRVPGKTVGGLRDVCKKALEGAHGMAPPTQFEELARTAGSSPVIDWGQGADGKGYNAVTSILFLLNGRAEEDTTNPTLLAPTRGFADLAKSGQWKPAELALGCAMHYVGDLASPGHTHWKSFWQQVSQNTAREDERFYHPDHDDFDHLGDNFWTDAGRRDKLSRLLESTRPRLIRRFDSPAKVCTAKGRIWMGAPGDFAWDEDLPRGLLELAQASRALWDDHWRSHGTANDFWAGNDFSGPCVDRFAAHLAGAAATAAGVIDWAFSGGTAEGKDKDGPYSRDATNFLGMAAALAAAQDAGGAVLTPEALQGKDCYLGGVDRDDYFPISGSQVRRVSVAVKEGSPEAVKAEVFDPSGAPLPCEVKAAAGSIDLDLGKAVDKFLLRVLSPTGAALTYQITFQASQGMELQFAAIARVGPQGPQTLPPQTIVSVDDVVRLKLRCLGKDGKPLANQKVLVGAEDPTLQQTVGPSSPRLGTTDAEGYVDYPADTQFGAGLTFKEAVAHLFRFFTSDGGSYEVAVGVDRQGFPSVLDRADYAKLERDFDKLIVSAGPGTRGIVTALPPIMPTSKVPDSRECMAAELLSLQYPRSATRDLFLERQLKAYSDLCPKALPVLIAVHAAERVEKNIVIYAPSATVCAAGLVVPPAAAVGCPILVAQAQKDALFSIAEGVADVWNPELNLPYAQDAKEVVRDAEFIWDVRSLVKNARSFYMDVSYLRSQGPYNAASLLAKPGGVSPAALKDEMRVLTWGGLKTAKALSERTPSGNITPQGKVELSGLVDVQGKKPLKVSSIRVPWSSTAWQGSPGCSDSVPMDLIFDVPPSAIQWLRPAPKDPSKPRQIVMEWGVADPAAVTGFAYLVDASPETDPATAAGATLTNETRAVEELSESGTRYFHLASQDAASGIWLPPRHYKLELPRAGMLDLVLCIDKSGSMADDIKAVQEGCDATLEALDQFAKANDIDLRVGLVTYTRHDEANWIQGNPLTADVATIRRNIQGISITNLALGKGGNEDMYGALMYAMNEPVGGQKMAMGWRPGAAKIVFPIGDEPPDDPDWEERTLDDVARVAKNLDPVHMYPLLTPKQGSTFLDPAARAMERIAKATGGQVFRVASAGDLPETVVAAVKLAVRQHRNEVWRKHNQPYVLYGAIAAVLGLMVLTTVGLILRAALSRPKRPTP